MGKWKNGKMGENGGKILCLQLQHATCCNIQFAYLTRLRSINSTRTTYLYLSSICICIYHIPCIYFNSFTLTVRKFIYFSLNLLWHDP